VNDFISSQPDGENMTPYTVMELALGFIRVANESMCRPIRNLTQARGHDTAQHVLACFGGAGGQHACAIARSLGMSTVFIHRCEDVLPFVTNPLLRQFHIKTKKIRFLYYLSCESLLSFL
jgi:5-oxoprolinase (ATP-hydrolysing)